MKIHPTSFTLEHIPKSLSPTGNITSAPKDFSVYVSVLGPGGASLAQPPCLQCSEGGEEGNAWRCVTWRGICVVDARLLDLDNSASSLSSVGL